MAGAKTSGQQQALWLFFFLHVCVSASAIMQNTCTLSLTRRTRYYQVSARYGGAGGGDEPGGLEGEVHGSGSAAHEVQSADHQDPRTHSRQGGLDIFVNVLWAKGQRKRFMSYLVPV